MLLKENARLAKIISRQNDQHELKKFKMTEQYDSDSEFETKIDSLVQLMKESKHCVIYTGAGISTAANIPDYRGKNGVWTSLEWSFHFKILEKISTTFSVLKTYKSKMVKTFKNAI